MFEQFDFDTLGRVSNKAVKDKAREVTMSMLANILSDALGAEFVSVVGTGEIALAIGSKTVDGISTEIPVVLKVISKEFEAHATASGKAVDVFDRYDEAKAFADEQEQKAKEKAEKKARDDKKKALDAKAREVSAKKKAEKKDGD